MYSGNTKYSDIFKAGMRGNAEARNISRRRRSGSHPFRRSADMDNESEGSNVSGERDGDSEPDLENA